MEKYITDERTGLRYELVGDYYLVAGDDTPEETSVGIWGQRHRTWLRKAKPVLFSELILSGKVNDYLADIDKQADEMFSRLVKELAEKDGITESLKASDQMEWVRRMNAVRAQAMEIVNSELIYS